MMIKMQPWAIFRRLENSYMGSLGFENCFDVVLMGVLRDFGEYWIKKSLNVPYRKLSEPLAVYKN